MAHHFIGIDFGTTNSVLSAADAHGHVRTARFNWSSGASETFRSVLCFWLEHGVGLRHACAQEGINEYLKDTQDSRLIQSVKTYLGSEIFKETRILGRRFELEDLISMLLNDLWARAALSLGINAPLSECRFIAGRPVRFAGANPDDSLAQNRLSDAYQRAGLNAVDFAYEPEGAAFWFARRLNQKSRVLVADFGGGTSDFSIVEIDGGSIRPLGQSGIGIAGDVLDFRLIDHVVSPKLGKGSQYESFGKWLDMPISYYRSFASWHLLSMIKTPKTLQEIRSLLPTSNDPDGIENLLAMIENEMGYLLYGAIAKVKTALSAADQAAFSFSSGPINMKTQVTRQDFESWINDDIQAIRGCVLEFLRTMNLTPHQIDKVFMTGGTSFVPAIQKMMADLFGPDKMASGDEFTSVSGGLALIARERHKSNPH